MNNPKYFLYARKSTEDEERQVMSIEAQLAELAEFAKRENLEIIEKFIESKSAKKPGRKIFNEMVVKIHASREPVGILSWHPDRLARNSVDGGQVIYLIDTQKIASLRFPTFWFEPTPQGLFMLQVAFGQSKYYSDNLSENVRRGIRQKLRRGEWPSKAPLGYVNNPKTRNIEPHPVKAKIIERAFEEFSDGKYTLESLGKRLAEFGLESKNRTPLAKATIQRMLTNVAYIGLIKHGNEIYEGNYKPILSRQLFEAVQKKLKERARPRHSKKRHDFPFVGLLHCGECGGMITAQFAKGNGGIYRYYRCTKKFGSCSQPYIGENQLAEQLKSLLQTVVLRNDWVEKMLKQVDEWQKEGNQSSRTFVQNLEADLKTTQQKLDKLVSAYLDGDIEKEIYLEKKENLMKQKMSFLKQKEDFGQKRKNWVEPLREWIELNSEAEIRVKSQNYHELKQAVEKIGTNRLLLNRKVQMDFSEPWGFAASRLAGRGDAEGRSPEATSLSPTKNLTCLEWSRILNLARTHFEKNS
jgi:site-specific DNA recombinase